MASKIEDTHFWVIPGTSYLILLRCNNSILIKAIPLNNPKVSRQDLFAKYITLIHTAVKEKLVIQRIDKIYILDNSSLNCSGVISISRKISLSKGRAKSLP